jgi:hypothetical protein
MRFAPPPLRRTVQLAVDQAFEYVLFSEGDAETWFTQTNLPSDPAENAGLREAYSASAKVRFYARHALLPALQSMTSSPQATAQAYARHADYGTAGNLLLIACSLKSAR